MKIGQIVKSKYSDHILKVTDEGFGGVYVNCDTVDGIILSDDYVLFENLGYRYGIIHDNQMNKNKVYWFKSQIPLKIGERVLLDTIYGLATGTVVKQANINDPKCINATKFIISKIDDSEYQKAIQEEIKKAEIEKLDKQIQELQFQKDKLQGKVLEF